MNWFRRRRVRRMLALLPLYVPNYGDYGRAITHGLSRRDGTRP